MIESDIALRLFASKAQPIDFAASWTAARMRTYVAQRQIFPAIDASMSASLGFLLLASSADADMICPDWQ